MDNNKLINILALSSIKGIGGAFVKKNLTIINAYADDIDMLSKLGGKVDADTLLKNVSIAKNILEDCQKLRIKAISLLDKDYPPRLREITNPPPILYTKGNLLNLNQVIAVIGALKSSKLGNKIAYKVGQYYADNWSICSSLEGIDRYAIYNAGMVLPNVIGVLSGGLNMDVTTSKPIRELAQLVVDNDGLLISEHPPNKREDQFSTSSVSRIQAGLSNALILVQSSKADSVKHAIKAIARTKRPIGVIQFSGNTEYEMNEIFSGNRLLLEKQIEGIAEMCKIKRIFHIKTTKIMAISKKDDYLEFEKLIANRKGKTQK